MARRLLVGRIADRFHQLPSTVARDLDADPEQLSVECLTAIQYADCKRDFDKDIEQARKVWDGTSVLEQVTRVTDDLMSERIEREQKKRRGEG